MTTTETTASTATASNTPGLAGIQHVGLTVRDVEASAQWYQQVLGLERQFDEAHHDSDQGGYAIVLGTPEMSFNLGLDHHPAHGGEGFDPVRTGLDHVCFMVASTDELAEWAEHLNRREIANSGVYPVEGTPFRLVTFCDPDGIQLELMAVEG